MNAVHFAGAAALVLLAAAPVGAEVPDLASLFPGEIVDAASCRAAHGRWVKRGNAEGCGDARGNVGAWRVYDPDNGGVLSAVTSWKDNVLEGRAMFFRPDGSVERTGQFKAGVRDGLWRGVYDNGAPRLEESFVNDRLEGDSKRWYPNGQLQLESHYVAGELDGPYIEWHRTCFKQVDGAYKAGKRTGLWMTWFKNGNIESEGSYEDDKQTGVWSYYHEEGALLEQGPYVAGERDGVWVEGFASGVKFRDVTWHAGVREGEEPKRCHEAKGAWQVDFVGRTEGCLLGTDTGFPVRTGIWTGYFPDGKRAWDRTFAADQEQGLAHDWHPTGEVLREGLYALGVPEGVHTYKAVDGKVYGTSTIKKGEGHWKSFYPDGKPREEGDYVGGTQDGAWTTWYDNGNRDTEQVYLHGMRDGVGRSWFESGEPKVEGYFKLDNRDGHWIAYYTNGRKAWEGDYVDGDRVGVWKNYYWEGELKSEGPHVKDDEVGHWVEYYDNGKKAAEGEYEAGKKVGTWRTWWRSGEFWREVEYVDGVEVGTGRADCDEMRGEWLAESDERFTGCRVCRWEPLDAAKPPEDGTSAPPDASTPDGTPPPEVKPKTPQELRKGEVRFEQEAKWTFWHDNGKTEKEGQFRDGETSGHWTFWYPDGKVMFDGGFEHGKEQGAWTGYFANGNKRFTGSYTLGLATGKWVTWGMEGKLRSEGTYDADGKKAGLWSYYYEDGAKKDQGEFKADDEVGVWTTWWPNGKKKGEGTFEAGKRVGSWTWWRETGEVWRAAFYVDGKEGAPPAEAPTTPAPSPEPPQ